MGANKPNFLYICEICDTQLDEHHCKARCPNCGRMLDCSDLPILPANHLSEVPGQRSGELAEN